MIRILHIFLFLLVVTAALNGVHWLATGEIMPSPQAVLLAMVVHVACDSAFEARKRQEWRHLHELYSSPSYGE